MTDTPNRLTDVFRAVFNNDAVTLTRDATASALTAVEKSSGVLFKGSRAPRLQNVGDLVDSKVGATA